MRPTPSQPYLAAPIRLMLLLVAVALQGPALATPVQEGAGTPPSESAPPPGPTGEPDPTEPGGAQERAPQENAPDDRSSEANVPEAMSPEAMSPQTGAPEAGGTAEGGPASDEPGGTTEVANQGTDPATSPVDETAEPPAAPDPKPPAPRRDAAPAFQDLVDRDGRVGFTPRTSDLARAALQLDVLGPGTRAAALYAAGVTGSVQLRHHVEAATVSEDIAERRAALVALGAYRTRIGTAETLLLEALGDPRTVGTALVSLYRLDPVRARRVAQDLIDAEAPGSFLAQRVLDWDGLGPGPDCVPTRLRLAMRWDAGRHFGTVDGRSWSSLLLAERLEDERFLDLFVLMEAAELRGPVVRDHLATLLVEDPGPVIARACVRAMPRDLDRMIGSGAWVPPDEATWFAILDEAVQRRVGPKLPQTMRVAAQRESLQPFALPFLAKSDLTILERIRLDLLSRKVGRRRDTVRGIGAAGLIEAIDLLVAMENDPSPIVRAEVWAARLRLGDNQAFLYLRDFLSQPEGDDPKPSFFRDRRLVLQSVLFHVGGGPVQQLLLELVDRLPLHDGRLPYLLAALRVEGHAIDADVVFDAIASRDQLQGLDQVLVRAAGRVPGDAALDHLVDRFPHGGAEVVDLELARALISVSHPEVEAILAAAVWGEDWHRGVLAAAVVEQHYGRNTLMLWALQPPADAGPGVTRRLGFAIGELGRLEALEELTRRLGHGGADRPVLQGALLGALSARTH